MSDGRLSCAIFLAIAVGIPLGLIGVGFVRTWWADRGTAVTRQRRRQVARAVADAIRDTGRLKVKTHVAGTGAFVSLVVRADYEQRKKLRQALDRKLAELDWTVGVAVEAADRVDVPRDPEWARRSHAYGDAGDIPYWLSKISPDSREEAWGELWSRLCHQGSAYDASFAALPALLAAARTWSRDDRAMPLSLAGAIVAGHDQAFAYEELHHTHASDIAELRELTLDSLGSAQVDRDTYIVLLQALAAFEDVAVWRSELDRLLDGAVDAMCPACESDVVIDIRAAHPRSPGEMSGVAARFYALATAAGQAEVATLLAHLFGETTCPACGKRFGVADAVAAATA